MKLSFLALEKALVRLKEAIEQTKKDSKDELLRDGCIQRFEYTFELAWKLLKRKLEERIGPLEKVDTYSKKDLFRVGGEHGLISNVLAWFDYLEKRNLTTHTYQQEYAEQVFSIIESFSKDVENLLYKLKST